MSIFQKIFFIIACVVIFSGCIPINKQDRITKTSQLEKKKRNCIKYTKAMNYAFSYINNEFEKGYFLEKDILGAKAQLFLIENQSKSIFAQNINNAVTSYNSNYQFAQHNKCNIRKFSISPLENIKNKVQKKEG